MMAIRTIRTRGQFPSTSSAVLSLQSQLCGSTNAGLHSQIFLGEIPRQRKMFKVISIRPMAPVQTGGPLNNLWQ